METVSVSSDFCCDENLSFPTEVAICLS